MKKKIFFISIYILIFSVAANALTFKIGGLIGLQSSFKNVYNNSPIGYIEHSFYKHNDWDIRANLGFTYLENTVFENTVLYGYSDTIHKIVNLKPDTSTGNIYSVSGPLNGERKLFLIPAALQITKYFKPSVKLPEFSLFGGINLIYYSEKYKQFTDSNDAQTRLLANQSNSGLKIGCNAGAAIRLSKNVRFCGQYNLLGSTKLHTCLNNLELTFKIEY